MAKYRSTAGNFVCADCGVHLTFQLVVSAEDWSKIADKETYALCPHCMDQRFVGIGATLVPALGWFMGKAIRTEVPAAWRSVALQWRLPEYFY